MIKSYAAFAKGQV